MSVPTFIPPIDPSPGIADKPEIKVQKADFGDGYTQSSRQLNNVRRVLSLKWDVLDADEASTILGFFAAQGGTDAFFYKVPGETTPILVTCEEWSDERAVRGYRAVSATFRQSFNVAAS